ncbi:TPA: hypothetical protein ACOEER_004944 [Enterobacter ludwigii]
MPILFLYLSALSVFISLSLSTNALIQKAIYDNTAGFYKEIKMTIPAYVWLKDDGGVDINDSPAEQ